MSVVTVLSCETSLEVVIVELTLLEMSSAAVTEDEAELSVTLSLISTEALAVGSDTELDAEMDAELYTLSEDDTNASSDADTLAEDDATALSDADTLAEIGSLTDDTLIGASLGTTEVVDFVGFSGAGGRPTLSFVTQS